MILDYVKNLKISTDEAEKRANEIRSLEYLSTGLHFLSNQVQRLEIRVVERLPPDRKVFLYGKASAFEGISLDLVACMFHWYSVTSCNYVRLVGWLAHENESDEKVRKNKGKDYLSEILPRVQTWRNKVGAHFALIDPRKEPDADLASSVLFPINFSNDTFHAGAIRMLGPVKRGDRPITDGSTFASWRKRLLSRPVDNTAPEQVDWDWSLTEVHRQLTARYWPERMGQC